MSPKLPQQQKPGPVSGCKLRLEKSVHFDLTTYNPHKGGGNFINLGIPISFFFLYNPGEIKE
jgi:hypothetical protein